MTAPTGTRHRHPRGSSTRLVTFWAHPDEVERWKRDAKREGVSLSEHIRRSLDR